jgi:Mg2+/Co2+ transporter CorB
VDKYEFDYLCTACKVHRRVDWYEPTNEAKAIANLIEKGHQIPSDTKRFFIGPMCTLCLETSDEYEVKGVNDGDGREES